MAHSDSTSGSRGRVVLWIAIIVLLALGAWATVFAIRSNPLYDAQNPGISRWKFIEHCKEEVIASVRPQLAQAGLPLAQTFTEFEAPARRVQTVAYVAEQNTWFWSGNLLISSPLGSGPYPFTCVYDAESDEVQLIGPAQ